MIKIKEDSIFLSLFLSIKKTKEKGPVLLNYPYQKKVQNAK